MLDVTTKTAGEVEIMDQLAIDDGIGSDEAAQTALEEEVSA